LPHDSFTRDTETFELEPEYTAADVAELGLYESGALLGVNVVVTRAKP
jgi:hypothetical protein